MASLNCSILLLDTTTGQAVSKVLDNAECVALSITTQEEAETYVADELEGFAALSVRLINIP